jgi:hypothetical protein
MAQDSAAKAAMISDGLKAENQDETIAQRDVAELLADSVL